VSASVNLPLHHKVQKFSSGTGSPGWSRKKDRKMVVCVVVVIPNSYIIKAHQYTFWNKQPNLTAIVQSRHLSIFGHIARMGDGGDVKLILTAPTPENWKRPPRRPHSTRLNASNEIWEPTTLHWTKQSIWLRTALCGGWSLHKALCTLSGAFQKRKRTYWHWIADVKGTIKGATTPFLMSMVMDKASGWYVPGCDQCFVIPSALWRWWLGDREGIWLTRNQCHLSPKVFFWNKLRNKTEREPDNLGSRWKWPLKHRELEALGQCISPPRHVLPVPPSGESV